MWLKSVIKHTLKYVPIISPELRDLISHDGRLEAGEPVGLMITESAIPIPGEVIEDMEEAITSASPPPSFKTDEFDRLVAERLEPLGDEDKRAQCGKLVTLFLEAIAEKRKPPAKVEQIKEEAGRAFDKFWQVFLSKWDKGRFFPAKGDEEPADQPLEPEVEPGDSEGGEEVSPHVDDGLDAVRKELWGSIILKGVPLANFSAVPQPTGQFRSEEDIVQENVEGVRAVIAAYKPSRGKGK
jgi:hypothetical protein